MPIQMTEPSRALSHALADDAEHWTIEFWNVQTGERWFVRWVDGSLLRYHCSTETLIEIEPEFLFPAQVTCKVDIDRVGEPIYYYQNGVLVR